MPLKRGELEELQSAITVEVVSTAESIREAQALRHQVYCIERKFLTADPDLKLEQDRFDRTAQHILVRRASNREVIATSRVVRSQATAHGSVLPMHRYCCPSLLSGLPMQSTGEISRFAISKQARDAATSGPIVRLALLRGVLQASQEIGLTHWCAVMEPSLMRLLSATGIQFTPLGPLVEAYGQRQPCVAKISQVVLRGRASHPHFYEAIAARAYSRAA